MNASNDENKGKTFQDKLDDMYGRKK